MNKLFTVMGRKFKFQVQDSDLEYLFWRFEKRITLSEKKPNLEDEELQFVYICSFLLGNSQFIGKQNVSKLLFLNFINFFFAFSGPE